jgi:hypothetical protein
VEEVPEELRAKMESLFTLYLGDRKKNLQIDHPPLIVTPLKVPEYY